MVYLSGIDDIHASATWLEVNRIFMPAVEEFARFDLGLTIPLSIERDVSEVDHKPLDDVLS